MNSPRGLADPTLGALAELLPEADLIVLLGKALDFTSRFGRPAAQARFVVLDPEAALLARAQRLLGERLVLGALADPMSAVAALAAAARRRRRAIRLGAAHARDDGLPPRRLGGARRRAGRPDPSRDALPRHPGRAAARTPSSSATAARSGSGARP